MKLLMLIFFISCGSEKSSTNEGLQDDTYVYEETDQFKMDRLFVYHVIKSSEEYGTNTIIRLQSTFSRFWDPNKMSLLNDGSSLEFYEYTKDGVNPEVFVNSHTIDFNDIDVIKLVEANQASQYNVEFIIQDRASGDCYTFYSSTARRAAGANFSPPSYIAENPSCSESVILNNFSLSHLENIYFGGKRVFFNDEYVGGFENDPAPGERESVYRGLIDIDPYQYLQ